MPAPVALKKSVESAKTATKKMKKAVKKHRAELKEAIHAKAMKRARDAARTNDQQAMRKLLRLTDEYGSVILSLQKTIKRQEIALDMLSDEVERQETYLLKEVKRLHALLSTRRNGSEPSMYIYGQNDIGGNRDSPFSIG